MGYVPPNVDDPSNSRAISLGKQTSKYRGVTKWGRLAGWLAGYDDMHACSALDGWLGECILA
jgi:hypothetical protein